MTQLRLDTTGWPMTTADHDTDEESLPMQRYMVEVAYGGALVTLTVEATSITEAKTKASDAVEKAAAALE